jgi:hydroxypyruvate isomerase
VTYRQSFAWWSFVEGRSVVPDLLGAAARIGYAGVDFLPPELWPRARDLGLQLIVIDGHVSLEVGFNDPANHRALAAEVRANMERAVGAGVPYLAVNAGNRGAHSDERAVSICAEGLAPLAAEAHAVGLVLVLEPLNSKVDHIGNQCDRTGWAAAVVAAVGSPGLKLLYDAYHMQIMEGDLIRTIETHLDDIVHVHTAGVPGRRDLDDRQEVNWRAIAHLLREKGYQGFVAHEFIPRADPVEALRQAFALFATESWGGGA